MDVSNDQDDDDDDDDDDAATKKCCKVSRSSTTTTSHLSAGQKRSFLPLPIMMSPAHQREQQHAHCQQTQPRRQQQQQQQQHTQPIMSSMMGRGKGRNLPAWMTTAAAAAESPSTTTSSTAAGSAAQLVVVVDPPRPERRSRPGAPPARETTTTTTTPSRLWWHVEWMDIIPSLCNNNKLRGGGVGGSGSGRTATTSGGGMLLTSMNSRKRARGGAASAAAAATTTTTSKNKNNNTTIIQNASSKCRRRIAIVDLNHGSSSSILVNGRGSLCCTRGSVEIHGYRLTATTSSSHGSGADRNDNVAAAAAAAASRSSSSSCCCCCSTQTNNKRPTSLNHEVIQNHVDNLTFLPFDVPSWSTSWLTITSVASTNDSSRHHCCGSQVVLQSAAASTDAGGAPAPQQQQQVVGDATFSIHDAVKRENNNNDDNDDEAPRPTVIPDGWKQSASDILHDYRHQQQQLHSSSSASSASLPSSSSLPQQHEPLKRKTNKQQQPPRNPRRFVVAITGGKSVGKSTYLKYLLHRFMSSFLPDDVPHHHPHPVDSASPAADSDNDGGKAQEAATVAAPLAAVAAAGKHPRFIAILDGDPGQPEFGPVGMLTLTVLQIGSSAGDAADAARPLWSPAHCNMVLPPSAPASTAYTRNQQQDRQQNAWSMPPPATRYERAYYYGSTTVQTDPQLYLECMSRLMTAYDQWQQAQQQSTTPIPLLINLHGWVKGLGYTLLQALLQQHLAPCRHVVQIMGMLSSQMFDLHSVLYNNSSNKDYSSGSENRSATNADHDDEDDDATLLHVIPSYLGSHQHHHPLPHKFMTTTADSSYNNNNNNNIIQQQTNQSRQKQFTSSSLAMVNTSFMSAKSFSTDEESKNHDISECANEEEMEVQKSAMSASLSSSVDPSPASTATTLPESDSLVQEVTTESPGETNGTRRGGGTQPPTEGSGTTDDIAGEVATMEASLVQEAPTVTADSSNDNHRWDNRLIAVKAPSIPAAAFRTLRLCTYFVANTNLSLHTWPQHDITFSEKSGLQDPRCRIAHCLAAEKPYVIPMECLSIRHVFENNIHCSPAAEQQWWHLLNASIVGLCYDHEDDCVSYNIDNDNNDHNAIVPPPPRCVGLGIVRSIDWQRRLLYLLTPIAPDQLSRVHVLLVGGNFVLPLQCTFRGANAEAFPYQSQSNSFKMKQLAGAEPMKSRNTLVRRNTPAGPTW
jgi:polynucleotide 5'-kinase involved in rRNA processing